MKKKRYHTLDGMRGVAALMVLIYHGYNFFTSASGVFPEAFLAVDFFFVLSGFVIAEAYRGRLENGLTWFGFMRLRVIRLYPLYLLGTLLGLLPCLGVILLGNHGGYTLSGLAAALGLGLFMLPSPVTISALLNNHLFFPLLPVAWSLFWELVANAVYAGLWPRFDRRLLLAFAVLGASGLFAVVCHTGAIQFETDWRWVDIGVAASRVIFSFFIGIFLHSVPRIDVKFPPAFLLLILAAALGFCPGPAIRPIFEMAFVILLSPALVYLGATVEPGSEMESKAYAFLGAVSYAIYVIHFPLEDIIGVVSARMHVPVQRWAPWSGLLFIAGLLFLCKWLDKYFDGPMRRWMRRVWSPDGGAQ